MRRNLVLAGLILLLVAVVMYFGSTVGITLKTLRVSGILQPGEIAEQSFSYKEEVITVTASPPIPLNVEIQGNVITESVFNNLFVAISSGPGTVLVNNNYTTPVKVQIVVVNLASPVALLGILSLLGLVIGVVGGVILVVGVVRKEKREEP